MAPSTLTTWAAWKQKRPETRALSMRTGYDRNYVASRSRKFDKRTPPGRPVSGLDARLPPRERVLGLVIDGEAKAYPIEAVGDRKISDELGGVAIEIRGEDGGSAASAWMKPDAGDWTPAPSAAMYWFAWVLGHPETRLFAGWGG